MKKSFVAFGIAFALVIGAIACVINYGQNKANKVAANATTEVERIENAAVVYANNSHYYVKDDVKSAKVCSIFDSDAIYGGKCARVQFFDADGNCVDDVLYSVAEILESANQQL